MNHINLAKARNYWKEPTKAIAYAVCSLALLFPICSKAISVRIDDTGTVVSEPMVTMKWRQPVPGRGADSTVQAKVRVIVHLDMTRWLNRKGHLYMALGSPAAPAVVATWSTAGRLLPGTVRSGDRALVFSGLIDRKVFDDTFELTLSTDGRSLGSAQSLQFSFEFDPS